MIALRTNGRRGQAGRTEMVYLFTLMRTHLAVSYFVLALFLLLTESRFSAQSTSSLRWMTGINKAIQADGQNELTLFGQQREFSIALSLDNCEGPQVNGVQVCRDQIDVTVERDQSTVPAGSELRAMHQADRDFPREIHCKRGLSYERSTGLRLVLDAIA